MFRLVTIGLSTAALFMLCMMFRPDSGLAAGPATIPVATTYLRPFRRQNPEWCDSARIAIVAVESLD
jgi:hypothetical protein